MPFGLSRRAKSNRVGESSPNMSEKYVGMILRLNIDCNACCRKLRRIVLRMKEIETHMIEKQQRSIYVFGRFVPSDVAIKIKKKMNRRVEILDVQEVGSDTNDNEQTEQTEGAHNPMVAYPTLPSCFQPPMSMAYCKAPYFSMGIPEVWEDCDCTCTIERDDEELLPWEDTRGNEIPSWEYYQYQY